MRTSSRSLVFVAIGAVIGAGVSLLTPGSDTAFLIPIGAAVGLAASEGRTGCFRRYPRGPAH